MNLRVSLLTPRKDAMLWREVVASLPQQDVHYLPEYVALYEESGVTAHAALLQTEAGAVLYPFLLRQVFMQGDAIWLDGSPARDIAVPYGIGGPVCTHSGTLGQELYNAFDRAFTAWGLEQGIASEFLCPHIYTGALEWVRSNPTYHCEALKPVVVVDLEGSEKDIYGHLNRGHKAAVNKARRNGVTVYCLETPSEAQYALFNELHRATLDRQRAKRRWYFDSNFFAQTRQALGAQHCVFFVAEVGGEVAAWQIVLRHGTTAYYHFAGTDTRFQALRPSTMLMYEMSLWAKQQGCTRLYLGGGVTADSADSVLRFKTGFSKETVMLYGAYRVLHQTRYARLTQMQEVYEAAGGISPTNPQYFPAYRRT